MVSKYVFKRNEIYYFRLKIPLDLKQYFPVKEIWKSLKTRSLTTARTAVSKLLYQTERLFLYARSGMLSNEEIKRMVADYLHKTLDRKEQIRAIARLSYSVDDTAPNLLLLSQPKP